MSSKYEYPDRPVSEHLEKLNVSQLAGSLALNILRIGHWMHEDIDRGSVAAQPESNSLTEKFYPALRLLQIGRWLPATASDGCQENQNFRLGTWVEKYDSRFGHALIFDRPQTDTEEAKHFDISTQFVQIDRKYKIPSHEPKELTLSSKSNPFELEEQTREVFDRWEMAFALSIIGKINESMENPETFNNIDSCVYKGLSHVAMDGLAD